MKRRSKSLKQRYKRLVSRRPTRIALIVLGVLLTSVLLVALLSRHAVAPKQTTEQQIQPAEDTSEQKEETTEKPAETKQPETKQTPPQSSSSTGSTASSLTVVVNKQHPLSPPDYVPANLVGIGNGQFARAEAAQALTSLLAAAQKAGRPMYALSGYRSYSTQAALYNSYVQSDGQAAADTYSARPGHSEHQTGLAIDVGNGTCNLEICFGATAAGKWLAANAHSYGFVIRYPNGKTSTTGYQYEPWHLRYIGTSVSKDMHTKGIATLEEYFGITGGTSY
jgi:LAS superfamily LD-carboxypeptidase LdcB